MINEVETKAMTQDALQTNATDRAIDFETFHNKSHFGAV